MAERSKDTDEELSAITQVIAALGPLDELARSRVLDYVFRRLGLRLPATTAGLAGQLVAASAKPLPLPSASAPLQTDIRMLKEGKNPKSAQEMAALVAYYVSELAPPTDRKEAIDAGDIKKYFKQADFRLPGSAHMTLVHARNAGYLDPTADRGQYKLNAVGYNLVVHNLPSRSETRRTSRVRKKPKKKPSRRR
jgi:hypothetical protein